MSEPRTFPAGEPDGTAIRRPRSDPARRLALAVGGVLAIVLTGSAGIQMIDHTSGEVRRIEHRVFPATVERVRVTTPSGSIRIAGTDDHQVGVDGRLSGTVKVPAMSAGLDGTTLVVRAHCPVFWDCEASFDLRVPAGVAVDVESSSGDVQASDLRAPVRLSTSSGDVVVRRVAGSVSLHTSSGDIRASDVSARTLSASTSSGDVTLEAASVPENVSAHSSSGDVRIIVPRGGDAYDVTVDTSSGDRTVAVRTDPLSSHRLRATTGSGDVSVRYADEP
jgi:DUF4097 and DUF4098 domain-containing protein YvlB